MSYLLVVDAFSMFLHGSLGTSWVAACLMAMQDGANMHEALTCQDFCAQHTLHCTSILYGPVGKQFGKY